MAVTYLGLYLLAGTVELTVTENVVFIFYYFIQLLFGNVV